MKAAVLFEPGKVSIEQKELQAARSDEVLIRVKRCGVCGTDHALFRGTYPANYPVVIGHEFSGEIVGVGKDVVGLSPGDRVTADPNETCGRCVYCRNGKSHLCENLRSMGVHRDGADAEYVVARGEYVYRIPDALAYEEAAFCEPLACAIHGIDMGGVKAGDTVVVIGGGPMGNLIAQCAAQAGATEVILSEPIAMRREKAAESGATTVLDPARVDLEKEVRARSHVGADVVFEAAGIPSLQESCFPLVRKGGTVVLFGVSPEEATIRINPFSINENEIRVVGSFNNPASTSRSLALLGSGACRVRHLISHEIELREFDRVFEVFGTPESLKLMVGME